MAKAILVAGIWWPTLFTNAEEFVKRCDDCQRTKTPRGRDDMPLRPMMGARAFAKWGIDFVGPIAPPAYRTHAQYIIVATNYLTKWIEAKAIAKNDAKTTSQFLYENIFTRYELPIEIVSDRGTHFINEVIEFLLDEFMLIHQKSARYHPQDNGQAESTNKILEPILTKIVNESRPKATFSFMGIQSSVQNVNRYDFFQHGIWDSRNFTARISYLYTLGS
ncbi:hypothetical protein L7F22_033459 [Adiantum nelumboides]|nr:hypothetical protein [Adiantum nelumboides]